MIARKHPKSKRPARLMRPGRDVLAWDVGVLSAAERRDWAHQRLLLLVFVGLAYSEVCAQDRNQQLQQFLVLEDRFWRPVEFTYLVEKLVLRQGMNWRIGIRPLRSTPA